MRFRKNNYSSKRSSSIIRGNKKLSTQCQINLYYTCRIAEHSKTCRSCRFSTHGLLINFFSPISIYANCISFPVSGYSLVCLPASWLLVTEVRLQDVKGRRALFHTCCKQSPFFFFSFLSS